MHCEAAIPQPEFDGGGMRCGAMDDTVMALALPQDFGLEAAPQRRPPKRRRMSVADFVLSQRSRQNQTDEGGGATVPSNDEETALVLAEPEDSGNAMNVDLRRAVSSAALSMAEQISAGLSEELPTVDVSRCFEAAQSNARGLMSAAAAHEKQEDRKPVTSEPTLTTAEDFGNDLSLKTSLELVTSHTSFRWLWRLPAALRIQHASRGLEGSKSAREAALDVCRDCLPSLMADPDKAVKWMDRIAACLSWYELEGPPRPFTRSAGGASVVPVEERMACRRVDEWDEAFRSLGTLLRQGLLSSFTIIAERFTVSVLGEGAAPYKCRRTSELRHPSQDEPRAVLFPSFDELRSMLQENHVPFEVANFKELGEGRESAQQSGPEAVEAAVPSVAIVPTVDPAQIVAAKQASTSSRRASVELDDIDDLRELRRDGLKVVTPEEAYTGATPKSSALWFEGTWQVHALLDVLRQHFLDAPLNEAAPSPPRLPRLVAPASFRNAVARSAEVLRTGSSFTAVEADTNAQDAKQASSEPSQQSHAAELGGCFFPSQVRRLLELLRVLLPSFSCTLAADTRRSCGINTFTKLGNFRVETVRCERFRPGPGEPHDWRWDFKLLGA
eukprot:TRINITY_DN3706_c0_g2_i1.p1 TRINITY_DN3706_c0_g2~~TRINITY_DN3706_c0_g2_i1.p1  ORF type:complete len:614 (-),score=94.21 TRINITY_DN3706_c0_g2_i1:65-1906(-)